MLSERNCWWYFHVSVSDSSRPCSVLSKLSARVLEDMYKDKDEREIFPNCVMLALLFVACTLSHHINEISS